MSETPLSSLGLMPREYNALMRAKVDTVESLVALTDEEILQIYNIGTAGLASIRRALPTGATAGNIAPGDIRLDMAATLYRTAEAAADAAAVYFAALRSVGGGEGSWQEIISVLEESEAVLGQRVDGFGFVDDGLIGPIRGSDGRRVLIEYWHSSTGRAYATARWLADQDIDLQAAVAAQNAEDQRRQGSLTTALYRAEQEQERTA